MVYNHQGFLQFSDPNKFVLIPNIRKTFICLDDSSAHTSYEHAKMRTPVNNTDNCDRKHRCDEIGNMESAQIMYAYSTAPWREKLFLTLNLLTLKAEEWII